MSKIVNFAALALSGLSLAAIPQSSLAEGAVDWYFAPYLWASNVLVDVNGQSSAESFSSLVSSLQFAFEGHLEGQGDHFGGFVDANYISLSDSDKNSYAKGTVSSATTLVDLAAVYSPGDDRFNGIDFYSGIRYLDLSGHIKVNPYVDPVPTYKMSTNDSFTDFLLGLRYTHFFDEHWGATFKGDGSFGQTKGTWSAALLVDYKTEHGAWLAGWRYLWASIEPGSQKIDMALSGPEIGYAFRF